VLGEYSEVLLEAGLVADEDSANTQQAHVTDSDIADLIISVLDSPYADQLTRQFTLAAITKLSSRTGSTTPAVQERIADILAQYSTNAELEIQQRAVEFASLYGLGEELRAGVLERMPPPELKATVMGVGVLFKTLLCSSLLMSRAVSENKPVGSTQAGKEVCGILFFDG
jgi:AP-1 complex subunit gamma-1